MTSRLLVLPAIGALLLGTATPASAVVSVSPSWISSDAASDLLRPTCTGGNLTAVGAAGSGDPCATLASLSIYGEGGADTVDLSTLTRAAFPALVSIDVTLGDDSDEDTGIGSVFNDAFTGNEGVGDSASGGDGDDSFHGVATAVGGAGDDLFEQAYKFASGGPGDDRFIQFTASSGIEGGDGYDTWEADFDQASSVASVGDVSFTMGPNDLTVSAAGMTQTVPISGIEHVEMGLFRLIDDTWKGSGVAASQDVRGFSGNDVLTTGGLPDVVFGGIGNDTLDGGAGRDVLDAGAGNDTVNARDGEADTIACGEGSDTVVADAVDTVLGCESVQLPAVVTPPPPPAPTPTPVVPDTSAVTGKKSYEKPAVAKFGFSSTTAGATFQCKVDKGSWKACTSKLKVKTAKLKVGKHTLRVRAVLAGQVDATPSVKNFTVKA